MAALNKIVIGLTGPLSGGKGTVAELLKEKNFFCTSLSDRINDGNLEELKTKVEEILSKLSDNI